MSEKGTVKDEQELGERVGTFQAERMALDMQKERR